MNKAELNKAEMITEPSPDHLGDANNNHRLAYSNVMKDKTFYPKTTKKYKTVVKNNYNYYKKRR